MPWQRNFLDTGLDTWCATFVHKHTSQQHECTRHMLSTKTLVYINNERQDTRTQTTVHTSLIIAPLSIVKYDRLLAQTSNINSSRPFKFRPARSTNQETHYISAYGPQEVTHILLHTSNVSIDHYSNGMAVQQSTRPLSLLRICNNSGQPFFANITSDAPPTC